MGRENKWELIASLIFFALIACLFDNVRKCFWCSFAGNCMRFLYAFFSFKICNFVDTGLLGYPVNPVCKVFGLINKYPLMKKKINGWRRECFLKFFIDSFLLFFR